MKLTEEQQENVFQTIKKCFSDFTMFDQIVAEKLRVAIRDTNDKVQINMKTTKNVLRRYYDITAFKTVEQKLVKDKVDSIFKACYVLILSVYEQSQPLKFPSVEKLLEEYPQFRNVDPKEQTLLLNFRNMLKITLLVIPARLNKQCLLKIAGRLEGSQNEYITGGGQKADVARRCEIYIQEGGIVPKKRPERSKPAEPKGMGTKRTNPVFSEKKMKKVCLQPSELEELVRGPVNPFPNASATSNTNSSFTIQPHQNLTASTTKPQNDKVQRSSCAPASMVASEDVNIANVEEISQELKSDQKYHCSANYKLGPISESVEYESNLTTLSDVASVFIKADSLGSSLCENWSLYSGTESLSRGHSLSREPSDFLESFLRRERSNEHKGCPPTGGNVMTNHPLKLTRGLSEIIQQGYDFGVDGNGSKNPPDLLPKVGW